MHPDSDRIMSLNFKILKYLFVPIHKCLSPCGVYYLANTSSLRKNNVNMFTKS